MSLRVLEPGPLTTVQDRGRPGLAHLGVPRAGALDPPAARLGNRLVGNDAGRAVLETTLGGLVVRAEGRGHWIAVTGAPCPVLVDGVARSFGEPEWIGAGSTLHLGVPDSGVRSYLAVAGGIDVAEVLGSRSTDTLAWVGPPVVAGGQLLPVGASSQAPRALDTPRLPAPGPLRISAGPQVDWFGAEALETLCQAPYVVLGDSNRVGLRLAGASLERGRHEQLASQGMVLGAVQVPPSGEPVVFLADHPTTGGYPVVAVVREEDLWQCAQRRPGERVRFRLDPEALCAG